MKTQVTIISAENLISPEDNSPINPIIRLLGHSAEDYLIGVTNYINNSSNPKFNSTFSFDFFRATYLDFCIYNHNFIKNDELIGIARLKVSEIVPTDLMKIPINYIRSDSILSYLTVRFQFESAPFQKGSCGFFKNQIFLYTTYQAISTDNNPVDIDCLIVDHKWKNFYVLNAGNWWTTVGRSSDESTVPVGVGYSQIRKLDLKKLKGCEVHFYIKSNTYNGKLSLNFGCMSKEGSEKIKICENRLTLFKQIEFDVKAGFVYSSPEKMIIKPLNRIEFTFEDSSDYNGLVNYLTNGLKMTQRFILPHNIPSSLSGHSNIAIVYGGTAYSDNYYADIIARLYVFEKSSKKYIGSLKNPNLNSSLEESTIFYEGHNNNYKSSSLNGNSKYVDNSSVAIHLDRLQKDFTVIICAKIKGFFLYDVVHPMIRIVDTDTNKELFFLPYKPSIYNATGELLFSIDYQDNSWVIVPIFYPVMDAIQLKCAAHDYLLDGCPPYNQYDFNVKPLIKGKDYEIAMKNQIQMY